MYGIKPALQTPPQATQGDNYGLDDGAIGEERASPAFVYDGSSTWGVRLVSKNTQSAYERKGGASPQGISLSPRGASPFAGGGPNGLLFNTSPPDPPNHSDANQTTAPSATSTRSLLPYTPHSTTLPAKHSLSPTRLSGHSPPQPPLSPPDRAFLHHPPYQTPDAPRTSHTQSA